MPDNFKKKNLELNDPFFCEELNKVCPKLDNEFLCKTIQTTSKIENSNQNRRFVNRYFNNLISKIKEFMNKDYEYKEEDESEKEHEKEIVDSDLVLKLSDLANQNDKLFFISFLTIFPNFSTRLLQINSSLKSHDLEFCALIKLNFDTKNIARIKNISVKAVESKKYRLRKKLNISSTECMYNWINRLDVHK